MTVADDLRQAAIDIFDELTGVPIDVIYRQRAVTYIPGGETDTIDTDHPLRVIREDADGTELAVAPDASKEVVNFMFVASELPIPASLNDVVIVGAVVYTIDSFANDPVDAITTLLCEVR